MDGLEIDLAEVVFGSEIPEVSRAETAIFVGSWADGAARTTMDFVLACAFGVKDIGQTGIAVRSVGTCLRQRGGIGELFLRMRTPFGDMKRVCRFGGTLILPECVEQGFDQEIVAIVAITDSSHLRFLSGG